MTSELQFLPITFPESASAEHLSYFGREVVGFNPDEFSDEDFAKIEKALYEHDILLFRNLDLRPEAQLKLIRAFDPTAKVYSHGVQPLPLHAGKSLLNGYIQKNQFVPSTPQVLIIGHGTVRNHEGIDEVTLKHGKYNEFHKTTLTEEEERDNYTRFFRWHFDASLNQYHVPKVSALYGIKVPQGPIQTVRYDDGTGDELKVTLGTTAIVSGKVMFDILPSELKSVAVRSRVTYAPQVYYWLYGAKAIPNGLGIVSEGKETPINELPPFDESKIHPHPVVWRNPVTGNLHLQVYAMCAQILEIDPLPEGSPSRSDALYPDGAKLTDLKEIRDLLYKLQRPGISPELVYPHPWQEKDLVLFHNRGIMHTVVGVFKEDQIRLFHQCNLASNEPPAGPSEDVETSECGPEFKWTYS